MRSRCALGLGIVVHGSRRWRLNKDSERFGRTSRRLYDDCVFWSEPCIIHRRVLLLKSGTLTPAFFDL